ncbi:uncharacterized protein LOC144711425 isoform X2 [Wolffia australiana]
MEVNEGTQHSSNDHGKRSDERSIIDHAADEFGDNALCRICHCVESEKWIDSALAYFNIVPPSGSNLEEDEPSEKDLSFGKNSDDLESGFSPGKSSLLDLGCSCENELARTHYACALKWFISRGSTVCEICGNTAKNIRHEDLKKIVACLRDYELWKERTDRGWLGRPRVTAAAELRRQRLSEIASWLSPQSCVSPSSAQLSDSSEDASRNGNCTMGKTCILITAGLLTVILAWLLGSRVGKVFFSTIKCGPTRNWVIVFFFWSLVSGIWSSRTRHAS